VAVEPPHHTPLSLHLLGSYKLFLNGVALAKNYDAAVKGGTFSSKITSLSYIISIIITSEGEANE
jgi:hypothetical protein